MPIIKVSAQEIKRGLPMKEDWYAATVKSITPEASKDKQSINYHTTLLVDDGSHEGREIKSQFNSKFMAPWAQFVSAVQGVSVDPEKDLEIDSDMLVGKPVKVKIKNDVYNGSLIPKFGAFVPIGTDTSIPF